MDIEGFAIGYVTLCVVALAVGIFAAIRIKSIWVGMAVLIYIFLSSALLLGILGGIVWLIYAYHHYVPERTQRIIDLIVLGVGVVIMSGVILVLGRRSKKAGKLVVNGQTKNAYLAQMVAMFLYFYVVFVLNGEFSRLIGVDYQSGGKIFWCVVIICCASYWYYSTEWRGSGFVYRGKVIPFTDVIHAQWESQWTKKLKIKLKNNEQELAFIVPEEMAPAIDKYLRAFFPNP
jgi:hypothetical protein